ncbi:hypothetical protein ABZZ17_20445 [Streptomyces sp. NPDC006512]|uniref:hypothetical protein n=1 Tax=Streptomyces sp. NPDC006512 TaxID=3154307 RepID=UPI0033BBD545
MGDPPNDPGPCLEIGSEKYYGRAENPAHLIFGEIGLRIHFPGQAMGLMTWVSAAPDAQPANTAVTFTVGKTTSLCNPITIT